jgi:integrase/recombinase XerD
MEELKIKFLNNLVGRGKAEGTKKAYDFDLTKFISYLKSQGITNFQAVTTTIIEDFLFELNVASSTKQRRKVSISRFFDFLYKREIIKSNPAINVESIKVSQVVPEFLSQEQCDTFLNTIEKKSTSWYRERDLTLVKLLLRTGLRRAEIVRLNISDIDLSKHTIKVVRKGNREEYVLIHNELEKDLTKYLKHIKRQGEEPLFLSKKGKRLSASSIWHLIKLYSHKAGLNENVTVHSLRHTFATTLLSKSLPLPFIQALMGHRSSQTTSRYLHIQNNQLSEAFNKVSFEGR